LPRAHFVLREYLEALLVAVIFATFARTFVVQAFKIPTGSMEENLLVGDHILVNKMIYGRTVSPLERRPLPLREVRRGDVVVFKFPEDPTRDFIKRCVGLAGDTVEIRDKQLFVNGEAVREEGYTYHRDPRTYPRSPFIDEGFRRRDNFGPVAVPPGHYFCLGDNRDNSNDSRFWGPVPESYVKGRALLVYWSFDAEAAAEDAAAASGRLDRLLRLARAFVTQTRWERSFRPVR
jgi:signal peptidase I